MRRHDNRKLNMYQPRNKHIKKGDLKADYLNTNIEKTNIKHL
jgi:hypothetical protein